MFGRLMGWALLGLAMLLASGDAVMALGPGEYVRLAAGDVWLLLAGRLPEGGNLPLTLAGEMLLALPAWMVLAPLGGGLVLLCRPHRRRFRYRSTHYS